MWGVERGKPKLKLVKCVDQWKKKGMGAHGSEINGEAAGCKFIVYHYVRID